ncbi:MAG: hypothetical protein QXJ68_04565, partial [Methanocellales archaeon]
EKNEISISIAHLHRHGKLVKTGPEEKPEKITSKAENAASNKESDRDSKDSRDSKIRKNKEGIQRRMVSASKEISSIYSLHIPKNIEFMLWTMSILLFFAIFIAYIYFADRVSPWILIPLLSIPVIFWLVFTFAAYWTETRVYYLIKRTLNYDIIQTLRGYRQYVVRRKEPRN